LPEECNPSAKNLEAPTRNLQNVKHMPVDQPAKKKQATAYRFKMWPVLKERGSKNLIFNKRGNVLINVTFRHVRLTIVVVGEQTLLYKLMITYFISVH
jgi:hypothetical protein